MPSRKSPAKKATKSPAKRTTRRLKPEPAFVDSAELIRASREQLTEQWADLAIRDKQLRDREAKLKAIESEMAERNQVAKRACDAEQPMCAPDVKEIPAYINRLADTVTDLEKIVELLPGAFSTVIRPLAPINSGDDEKRPELVPLADFMLHVSYRVRMATARLHALYEASQV